MKQAQENFDVVVIGGGPGGSTAATLIAMQGHKVLLLEKEHFPRYHIGESLLPATIHGICTMLGISEEVKHAGFVKKLGGTLRWGKRPEPWTFWFEEAKFFSANPESAGQTAYAYQVVRSKFDDILLRNAKSKGVDVREGHSVKEVIFEDGRAVGVRFHNEAQAESTAQCKYVVDATGGSGLLSNKIGQRIYDKFFKNLALFGYFKGGKRYEDERRKGNIITAAFNEGWLWYIPLSNELTSVGAVVPIEHASKIKELGYEKAYHAYIESCPIIKEFVEPGTRITEGEFGEIRVLRDFSYLNTKFWAPGAVLVGDAACFIDPVFSSGVHLATYSAMLAARSINTCLRGELDENRCFEEFEKRYRREYGVFCEFLMAFYEMHQDETSYFWTARKILHAEETEREAFVRLVAGLSNQSEPIFQSADNFIQSTKKLGEVMQSVSEAAITGKVMADDLRMAAMQQGKMFYRERTTLWSAPAKKDKGEDLYDASEKPIFEGGLVPSTDGLRWHAPPVPSST